MRDLSHFVVDSDVQISMVLKEIEQNQNRAVFVKDETGKIVGIATDGDIRRFLIQSPNVQASISACMNKSFISAPKGSTREYILKLLDHQVQVLPILDENGRLFDVVTTKDFPLVREKNVVVRAKSPVRISFGGGGTDLTHYFVKNDVGVVINATLKMYTHSSLKKRSDGKILIYSADLDQKVEIGCLKELENFPKFRLIESLLKLINPDYGFELLIYSDFPIGSGLGGSAVVLSSIIGCFNQFREDLWDRHEIAELAFQAERIFMNMAGGWQDQYATVFGGFNFIEFREAENIVHPLRIKKETQLELEGNLILCNSMSQHVSGAIHIEQKKHFEENEEVKNLVNKNRELCYEMKSLILRGQVDDFGRSLDRSWQLKRNFSSQISNIHLDKIYNMAIEWGALGGKLLGAGGGGFFLFYVRPENRLNLIKNLEGMGLETRPVQFDDDGLQTWKVRLDG